MKKTVNNKAIHLRVILLLAGLLVIGYWSCSHMFRRHAAQFADGGTASAKNLKTPLKASVAVRQHRGNVLFSLKLTDADGREIRTLNTGKGRPLPPKVEVFSEEKQKVYSCTLEYG